MQSFVEAAPPLAGFLALVYSPTRLLQSCIKAFKIQRSVLHREAFTLMPRRYCRSLSREGYPDLVGVTRPRTLHSPCGRSVLGSSRVPASSASHRTSSRVLNQKVSHSGAKTLASPSMAYCSPTSNFLNVTPILIERLVARESGRLRQSLGVLYLQRANRLRPARLWT